VIERIQLAEDYSISRLIHGGWQFSAGHRLGGSALDDAMDVLTESAEAGVTTFDCADIYTGVEELYGRFLAQWKTTSARVPIQIHTKLVPDYSDLESVDRQYVRGIVERSLTRLGIERLDLVQYYWWRDDIPGLEQTGHWLTELKDEGKIRLIGVTNLDGSRVRRVVDSGVEVATNQIQYSALDRRPEGALSDVCRHTGTRMIAFGALAGGFLTDRWLGKKEPEIHDNRSLTKYRLIIDEFGGWDAYQALLAELGDIGARHGVEASAVAIRFVLDQTGVAAVISGATRRGQMERNSAAFDFTLSAEDHARIRRHTDRSGGPGGPVFGLERDRSGPHGRIMKYDLNREAG
jgi:aryl-alcohol dehydrogenase-like predicted oxidoreductase